MSDSTVRGNNASQNNILLVLSDQGLENPPCMGITLDLFKMRSEDS